MTAPARRARGVATIEFALVLLLAALPLALGILQIALLLVAKDTVNLAAFMAARAGAVNGGDRSVMTRQFASGLVPLYVAAGLRSPDATAVATAFARALADVELYGGVQVRNPTVDAFTDFAQDVDGVRRLPNDALEYRDSTPGAMSHESIQDANRLTVEMTHCQRLIVPWVDSLLTAVLARLDGSARHQLCYGEHRVPLVSRVSVPMQSDARYAAIY